MVAHLSGFAICSITGHIRIQSPIQQIHREATSHQRATLDTEDAAVHRNRLACWQLGGIVTTPPCQRIAKTPAGTRVTFVSPYRYDPGDAVLDREYLEYLELSIRRRFSGITIPDAAWFGGDKANQWFLDAIKNCTRYLEFGTGGSTYLAAKNGVEFVAVDSDRAFLNAVNKKIVDAGFFNPSTQTYRYADIGKTGFLGFPVHWEKANPARLEQFRRYSDPPAECSRGENVPDLVLVDGRFRVACALKALRMLQGRQNWTLAIDDYVPRDRYHVVAEFAEIDEFVSDRIAVIHSTKNFSQDDIDARIREYETVPA
ncbi:MAG: hypothetical protein K0R33_738 [Mycobacterium sp.]|uniref:Uncharacterized protein n=1 Tax=Mycolicibacterium frederiksbergense TaxID=117567 RepID=A0A6H0SE15_9MYCO|nr:hypothetical protein [Mycolicibacterium frederiksbergense]MDF2582095.1 hypothetical protein [Mycobacterium sp.]QIV84679.1 hypothetical protein EXE63_30210 [Mycolicibacterium frederiksbergense]